MNDPVYQQLIQEIRAMGAAVVAFSGGVDSSFLAYVAHRSLGDKMVAITIKTPYIPAWEIEEARLFAKKYSFCHEVIELEVPEDILQNPPDRCYHCKKKLFTRLVDRAKDLGFNTVIDGSNSDDLADYRPGMRALEELRIRSPLLQLKIDKKSIRNLSRELGLATWNKPAYACLLTRIPYHIPLSGEEIARIARSEEVLRRLNISGARVRSHGDIARIELPIENFPELLTTELRTTLISEIQACGFLYVTLDLEGYITGSMNRTITTKTTDE